jgi:hypothetical protein
MGNSHTNLLLRNHRANCNQTFVEQGSFQKSLVEIGSLVSEEKIFFNFILPFSIFSLAAILVGSRDHRTQFWKVAIQGSFHKSLVAIGPVVSEQPNLI